MTEVPVKHFPPATPETEAYWDACRKHELLLQHCVECGTTQFYPRIVCTKCTSEKLEWVKASGQGQVVAFTIVRRAVSAAYVDDVPYVVALVRLDEGPTMMSNVVQCDPETVVVGSRVEVIFEDWSDEVSIPQFRPFSAAKEAREK